MFAIAAFVVFVIGGCRDFFATAPTHQTGVLFIGLALLALHLVWTVVLPRLQHA